MKKIFSFLLFFSLLLFVSPVSIAQIYYEEYSKFQKNNLFKENRVWMVYGWAYSYNEIGEQAKKGKKISFERFDREGNRSEEIYYDDKGNPSFSCEYLYDEKGNKIKEMGGEGDETIYEQWNYLSIEGAGKIERKSAFKKSRDEKWVYQFDAHQNITTETYFDNSGVMSTKLEFIYDNKQNITSKTEYDSYGNIHRKWVYSYDEKGNNFEIHHYLSGNQLHRIYQMRYDKKGNLKSKFTFDKDENVINLTVYVYQFYDGLHSARVVGNKQ
jgi:hypothetical protein